MKAPLVTTLTLFLFIFLTAASFPGLDPLSPNSLILTDSQDEYSLVPYLEILVDPDQTYTFEQISSPELATAFLPASEFDYSVSAASYWLRLDLSNQAKPSTAWLLIYDNYRLNHISAYLPEPETGGYREVHTGNTFPFSSRDFDYHFFVFNLNLPQNKRETVYLYLYDVAGVSINPLKIQSFNSFSQVAIREQFWAGAFYFTIFTIAIYTIFFIFSLNDRTLLSFFVLLITVLITTLSGNGLGHQLIWPNWTAWARVSTTSSALLYLAAFLHYTLVSLETRKYFPHLAAGSYILVAALVALLFVRLLPGIDSTFLNLIFVFMLALGFLAPILLSFRSLKVQKQQARYFLLAFSIYLVVVVAAIIDALTGPSILEGSLLSRVAFIWILLVFSISTNLRINRIRHERAQAQEQLLKEQQEALYLQTQLADTLRQSRDDIVEAYDTTLEGWAQLLELRDKETEGHSRNVVELTLRFAKQVGIPDDELVHIRRGALLHDIGKIAIPDSILLKPGPLTDEEWEIMRQHPVFALKFLSNIPYLEKAIDIPAYHHERWDGNGYAHQLKGEDIPLSARIFTIVDNWDALLSDRPYRKAWSTDKVKNYLIENTGRIFDPNLVQVFLNEVISA